VKRSWHIRQSQWLIIPLLTILVLAAAPPARPRAQQLPRAGTALQSDWPLFGRDRDNTRFVPLAQITAGNVRHLGEAWSTSLGQFQVLAETFPQVIGRVMYVTTSTDEAIALDAVSGKVLWKYAPQVDFSLSTGVGGYGVSVNRGVAVANGKVYLLTFDNKLVALQQATGEQLWQTTVSDPHQGYYETMAPTVWNGLVFVGDSGSEDGLRGFVRAYNAATGKQVWNFWTVPAPGQGWVPKGRHGGGTVYMPPTVDTRTGLLYVGTSGPSPVLLGTKRPGPNLYTTSILALQARTGKLVWYYQEVPHDLWDYDAASPVVIFDAHVKGKTVHAVGEAGKSGYFFILDARTGKPLFSPLAFVKVHHTPPTTRGAVECPGAVGGSLYSPVAYSAVAHAAYIAGINLCFFEQVTGKVTGGERDFAGIRKPVGKGTGTFSAVDVNTGKFLWKVDMPTPMIGGATVTASNLVFTGDQHGMLYAFDARSGKILWRSNLGLAFGSAPIVYANGGKEYVAIALGGSASSASLHLGNVGAVVVALSLDGKPIRPFKSPGAQQ
jgi:PQQ-dependent dehydrogenase (methanol/ethanol family)